RGAGNSILLVAVLHSMFNRTNNDDGIAASILTGEGRATAIPLAVIVLTAVTALVIRRRLSRAHRLHLDAQPVPGATAGRRVNDDGGRPLPTTGP
ncbi:MAG TPA: hypothetical protein VES42_26995, partial [Pilimelia sp.]|nr:hypothetical protein [Pilimelia sp.]